ncbi:MAG: hypothetical protein WD314_02725 [Trueperaceae bacterium]
MTNRPERRPDYFQALWLADRSSQNEANGRAMSESETPVEWAYEFWDELIENLRHRDGHNRAIAAQLLCNLAKCDPEERILSNLSRVVEVTRDERFVTARHCLQSLWKIGVVGPAHRDRLVDMLAERFEGCGAARAPVHIGRVRAKAPDHGPAFRCRNLPC